MLEGSTLSVSVAAAQENATTASVQMCCNNIVFNDVLAERSGVMRYPFAAGLQIKG